MDRRDFLRRGAALGGAAWLGAHLPGALAGNGNGNGQGNGKGNGKGPKPKDFGPSLLSLAAPDAPVDTIVVLMMENRSVDHYLGWLSEDEKYLAKGRRFYGDDFHFLGDRSQTYLDPQGVAHDTFHLPSAYAGDAAWRGCGHPDPGHGWNAGRAQMQGGFLAQGSGNDEFAIGYYEKPDLPLYAELSTKFTTFDHYHCSLLTSTYPNREYLHSAQSGGISNNVLPPQHPNPEYRLGFTWPTIWDRLRDQAGMVPGVDAGYFFVDLPAIALWGPRMIPFTQHIEEYFARAASGTLPRVCFVDPGFTTGMRTDDHPYADVRAGQKLVTDIVKAFRESPHWGRGAMFITYDEWGGFFDHVTPPQLPDDLAAQGFGQSGFRVPTMMLSPYALPGYADHRTYDHTSILRFIEWRFLGAPAEGPEPTTANPNWWLVTRDRHALNIGASLRAERTDADADLPALPQVPITSLPCPGEELEGTGSPISGIPHEELPPLPTAEPHAFEQAYDEGFFDRMGFDLDMRPIPTL